MPESPRSTSLFLSIWLNVVLRDVSLLDLSNSQATSATEIPAATSKYRPKPIWTDIDTAFANGLSLPACDIVVLKLTIFQTPRNAARTAGTARPSRLPPRMGSCESPRSVNANAGMNSTSVIQPSPAVPYTEPIIGACAHGRNVALMPSPAAISIPSLCLCRPDGAGAEFCSLSSAAPRSGSMLFGVHASIDAASDTGRGVAVAGNSPFIEEAAIQSWSPSVQMRSSGLTCPESASFLSCAEVNGPCWRPPLLTCHCFDIGVSEAFTVLVG